MTVFSKWQICKSLVWNKNQSEQSYASRIRYLFIQWVCCQVHASLLHKEEFTVHIRQPHQLFKKKNSGWGHNQQVLKERQHWDHNLGSDYKNQPHQVILLTLSLSGIIHNSIEICITTREPDKYTETQNMNQTKVRLPDIVHNSIQGRENNQGYI